MEEWRRMSRITEVRKTSWSQIHFDTSGLPPRYVTCNIDARDALTRAVLYLKMNVLGSIISFSSIPSV